MPNHCHRPKVKIPRVVTPDSSTAIKPELIISEKDYGSYETNTNYKNGFNTAIRLIHRNGLSLIIPPKQSGVRSLYDFVIDVRTRATRQVTIDVNDLFNVDDKQLTSHQQQLKLAFAASNRSANGLECVVRHTVTMATLEASSLALYVEDMDVVITTLLDDPNIVHPYSKEAKALNNTVASPSSYQYRLDIVDPDNVYGIKYTNIAGRVYRVNPCIDPTRKPGVYVYAPPRYDESAYTATTVEEFYSFDSVPDHVMLYSNAEIAKELGDVAGARKREHEHMVQEYKLIQMKAQAEIELLKMENTRLSEINGINAARLKHENMFVEHSFTRDENTSAHDKWIRERILMEQKYKLESEALTRKNTSEYVKWLPTILVGIGVILSQFKR